MKNNEFAGAYDSWRRELEEAEADFVAGLIEEELGGVDVEVPALG